MNGIILSLSFLLSCEFVSGQGWAYNRLLRVEQNKPHKTAKIATRHIKLFPKDPSGYYFLSKVHYKSFEENEEDKIKSKYLLKCLKLARKAQTLDDKLKLVNKEEWLDLKEKIKYEGFFYSKETTYSVNLGKLKKEYNLFISNGEDEYLLESQLNLEVPQEQRVDSLFYGLPTGKEFVKRAFEEEELKMLDLINQEREKLGLSMMVLDSSLSAACRYHAYDMGTQNYVGHMGYDRGSDGRMYYANYTFDRIMQFYNKTRLLGENISLGRSKAYYTYKGWYKSTAHNKIMFKPENRLVGIGFVHIPGSDEEFYWVLCTAE